VSINQNGARPNAQPLQHQRSASVTSQCSATLPVAQPPVAAPPQPAPQPPPQSAPQQPPSQQQRTTPPPVPPVHQTPPLQPQQKAHTNGAAVSPEQLAALIQRAGDDGADVQVPGHCVSVSFLRCSGGRHVLLGSEPAQQQCRTSPPNRIVQAIAGEVSRALDAQAGSGTPADAVLGTWVGAFMATVFNEANVQKRVSVVPYMEVLT
jgi:outer membrane biosynthesis protein TonB